MYTNCLLASFFCRNSKSDLLCKVRYENKMAGAKCFVDLKLKQRNIVLFSKSYSPECINIKEIIDQYNLSDADYEVIEIEKRQDCVQIENYFQMLCLTDSRQVPQLFVEGRYIGGAKEINMLHQSGELKKVFESVKTGIDNKKKD